LREIKLQSAEIWLAASAKYVAHRHSGSSLDLFVEVEKWPSQSRRYLPPDRRFPCPGQPDENYVVDHRPALG